MRVHLFFFFLLLRPPPAPPLFPYTPLFRSQSRHGERDGGVGAGGALEPRRSPLEHLDRKSTRLNSSHGYISYAVFCLKKKKKTKKPHSCNKSHTLQLINQI